jgi:hypothetical protein
MKKTIKFISFASIGMVLYIVLSANCLPRTSIPVDGFLFGRPFKTTVDNGLAKQMLTNPTGTMVTKLFSDYKDKPLNTNTLAEIAANNSMDVATLYFLLRAYHDKQNKQAQNLYLTYLDQLSDLNYNQQLSPLKDFYVAFVPGLDYNDTTNGGNFARQRRLLNASGIQNELILTDDWGLTDDNAVTVAMRLNELSKYHSKIIVVSASKGGLETAVALGKILKPEETKSIKAWVSVGGILNGSPVADTYLCWPKCWIAEIGLLTVGQKISLVQDLSYKKRAAEFSEFNFPDNIKRVHFVGAPLSTQIHKRIKDNYCSIKKFGPNDGITPLADEVSDKGLIISELGFDHYYKHPEIDKKTIALALVVAHIQN